MEIKSKYSLRTILLLSFLGTLLFGLIALGIIFIYMSISRGADYFGLIMGVLFLWMGAGYAAITLNRIKSLRLSGKTLIIKKPLLNRKTDIKLSEIKFLDFEESLPLNSMKGIMLKYQDGTDIINIKEYKNSRIFIDIIKTTGTNDDSIRQVIWDKKLKYYMLFGVILLFVFIFFKLFE